MKKPGVSRQPGPPHNPGLRELVTNKRQWSASLNREEAIKGFRGWHERGYLPHRDEPGLTQFVTLRLVDTFPVTLRSEWQHLWEIENDRQRKTQLEAYLDKGRGRCYLRQPDIAKWVEDELLLFHHLRYELRAWVIMPNHVHALFKTDVIPMSVILANWKKHTARQANRLIGRTGSFWEGDYWDTYMRDSEHELRSKHYIENNPIKAGLVRDPKEWPWSSARFRDKYGALEIKKISIASEPG